jgi:hypothetical protein
MRKPKPRETAPAPSMTQGRNGCVDNQYLSFDIHTIEYFYMKMHKGLRASGMQWARAKIATAIEAHRLRGNRDRKGFPNA